MFRKNAQASREFLDHTFFPRTKAGEINLGSGEFDSPIFGLMGLLQQFGYMKQSFRWDAAAVEADSAGIEFGIDQGDGHAEIGSEKCGGIATGAAADYCDIQSGAFGHRAFNTKDTKVHEGKANLKTMKGCISS